MQLELPKTITVDGVEHQVSDFSETVQRLVSIHTSWRGDLADERLAVAKTEAAIRGVDAELAQLVGAELKAKAEPAPEAAPAAPEVASDTAAY